MVGAVNRVLARTALVAGSITLALAIAEAGLAVDGRYEHLVKAPLVASNTIWERPPHSVEEMRHPDVDVMVETRTDAQGIRNHSTEPTETKENIIGVFGDSFTENRRVNDEFTFTSLLDGATRPAARVVNYGVDGYGVDQAYLRYKKYETHDIRHVVYVFGANDLRNLYETGLASIVPGQEDVTFSVPAARPIYRLLGRLRLTYLIMSVRAALSSTDGDEQIRAVGTAASLVESRTHDAFAESLVPGALTPQTTDEMARWVRTFQLVVRKWQREVVARGRTFTVVVLPRSEDTALAGRLFQDLGDPAVLLETHFGEFAPYQFKNDGHWNEYGNLKAAEFLAAREQLPFHSHIVHPDRLDGWRTRIDEFYRNHR